MFRLQSAQTIMLAYEKNHPGSTTYHLTSGVNLTGKIDANILKQAITEVMMRHDILRSRIKTDHVHESPYFSVLPDELLPVSSHWPLNTVDAKSLQINQSDDFLGTLQAVNEESFTTETFAFDRQPLWRCILIQLEEEKFQFILLGHHLILDGPSIGILYRDISHTYNNLKFPNLDPLPRIPSLERLDLSISEETEEKRLNYWRSQLNSLNTAKLKPDLQTEKPFEFNGKRLNFELSKEIVDNLKHTFPDHSTHTIMVGILYLLLHRFSNENDLTIGITSANRRNDEKVQRAVLEEQLINSFFNSLALRHKIDTKLNFNDLLIAIKETIKDGLKNQLPLDTVMQQALPPKSRAALRTAVPFGVMLVVNEQKPTLTLAGVTASTPKELDLGHCKFLQLGLNFDKMPDDSYRCFLEFNTDMFHQTTMERLINSLLQAAHSICKKPKSELANIPIISKQQQDEIATYNDTNKALTFKGYMPDLLEQHARNHPERNATTFHNVEDKSKVTVNYKELAQSSRQLAYYLMTACNLETVKSFGLCLSRSDKLVSTMYGIMQTGLPVVPLDANSPSSLEFALKNTNTQIVIVDSKTNHLFSDLTNTITINLDDPSTREDIEKTIKIDLPKLSKNTPAYIMHTSGTTDTPKGVIMAHGALRNLLNSLRYDQSLRPMSQVICTALPTFDAFFFDMLVALTTGGALHLCTEKDRYSPAVLQQIIDQEKINYGVFLPSVLDNLNPNSSLQHVISMGSAPHKKTLNRWAAAKKTIENGLGHTETGICLALQTYRPGEDHSLIGQPIRNMQIHILNQDGGICPVGVMGEIYVTGPGLAEGYLNNEKANTAFKYATYDAKSQRFNFTNRYAKNAIKLYASGDYGCLHQTRNKELSIKFIGRKDRQLKIHGVRVELDALESTLRNHPNIENVAAIPTPNKNGLIIYVLPKDHATSSERMRSSICDFLSRTAIPTVAYPKTVKMLRKMPLTANGKIDTKSLPPPIQISYPSPSSKLSALGSLLQKIWGKKTVLNLSQASIDPLATFEELGGNSISIATLETELNKARKHHSELSNLPYLSIELLTPRMTINSLEAAIIRIKHIPAHQTFASPSNSAFFAPDPSESSSESLNPVPINDHHDKIINKPHSQT